MNSYSRIRADIDLDAICHNLDVMRSRIAGGAPFCAVIKADGYGHGAVPIAHAIEPREDLWGFAVATAEEGAELRAAGIRKPILLLGYAFPESFPLILRLGLRSCVFDLETAERLSETAAAMNTAEETEGCYTAKVHIALDTGMSRIGFQVDREAAKLVRRISELPALEIEGLFSHFARADEVSLQPAEKQLALYRQFEQYLEEEGVRIPIHHIANSAGIMRFPAAHRDLVRAGITLYGLAPSLEVAGELGGLRPAMRLISHVSFVKTLPAGREISYGGTSRTEADTVVATIPVGYADGYPRQLSGKGCVLIRGQKAPILGRVCMDQFMVDVTHIPGVKRGDEVVLLGGQTAAKQSGAEGERTAPASGAEEESTALSAASGQPREGDSPLFLSAEALGALSGRFNYELVCDISKRVPRNYLRAGRVVEQLDYFPHF